jgi:hypothetical protein
MTRAHLLAIESELLSRLQEWPDSEWERLRLQVEISNVRYFLGRVP